MEQPVSFRGRKIKKYQQSLIILMAKKPPGWNLAAVVTVDARGQLVLPADVRKKLGLKGGEKFALVPCSSTTCPSAMTLIRVEELGSALEGLLGPLLRGLGGSR